MEALAPTIIGGAIAITATLVGIYAGRRGEHSRWRRDIQVQLSTQALSSLQQLIRATIDVAYSDLQPRRNNPVDTPQQGALRSRFESAVTSWNAALYAVLVGGDRVLGDSLREIDRHIDRLTTKAMRRTWDRAEFRAERRPIGEAMAQYVDLVRKQAGLPPLGLPSIWTWADDDDAGMP